MNYEEMIKNVEEILIKYKESLAKDPTIDYRNFAAHEIADIVFKAGEDKGYAHARQHCEDVIIPQARQDGRKEVIRYLVTDDNGLRIELSGDKWGNQLKEWSIE